MSAEIQTAVPDAPDKPEPTQATEQTETNSYADALLQMAAEDGHEIGLAPPKAETAEPETLESEVPATEPGTEAEPVESEPAETEPEEEEKPEAKKGDEWPDSAKSRVAEETAKRKRANERAEKAEALAAQYQEQLTKIVAPRPTEDDPFRDINDPKALDGFEATYEQVLDRFDTDPDGLLDQAVEAEKKRSGIDLLERFTPDQILAMTKRRADKAIRKFIPERRTYLQQRAQWDAEVTKVYTDLQDPDSDFSKATAYLEQKLMSGEVLRSPDVKAWIARAVLGYHVELQAAKGNGAKTPESQRIVESSRQKIAPAPVRSRSFIERGGGSGNVEKANKEFAARGDAESAEKLVGALLSRKSGTSTKLVQ